MIDGYVTDKSASASVTTVGTLEHRGVSKGPTWQQVTSSEGKYSYDIQGKLIES